MEIKNIQINNFKSLVDIKIINPYPFSVFVGSNSSGKSNIFEAFEFLSSHEKNSTEEVERQFKGLATFANRNWYLNQPILKFSQEDLEFLNSDYVVKNHRRDLVGIELILKDEFNPLFYYYLTPESPEKNSPTFEAWTARYLGIKRNENYSSYYDHNVNKGINSALYIQFIDNFSRIFIKNKSTEKFSYDDDKKLSSACGNLEKVLKRLLKNVELKEEIVEWLQLLIPDFENIEIKSEELSGTDNLLIYEKGTDRPFPKHLISDGTYNIIALLTAVYQSDEPQFLCIEEPENGLNPKVVQKLVSFFREQCEKKGHYIWLNTHSQTLVRELSTEEIIIVDKVNGETKIKQIKGVDLHGLPMDEALLTNAIGGGIPW